MRGLAEPRIGAQQGAHEPGRLGVAGARRRRARNASITGVGRGAPGTARRVTAVAARTAALSSRGIEPWPHVPWTVSR